jgi:enediyne biosynthesis protein E4
MNQTYREASDSFPYRLLHQHARITLAVLCLVLSLESQAEFQLEGTVANRSAIGAKVRVKVTVGGKTLWQMREPSASGACQNDLRPNFGLGDATNVDVVRFEWPSGNVQELANLAPNQIRSITELSQITPANPSLSLNGSVTLTRVSAVAGVSYQWRFDGADLPGQTDSTLTLENIQASQQGRYSVVVATADKTVTNYVNLRLDPVFTKITTGPEVTDLGNSANGSWGDYDGDGYVDLLIARYGGLNGLYRNRSGGSFTSITDTLFTQESGRWLSSACGDLDNDGRLDIFAIRESQPRGVFYFNNGGATFVQSQIDSSSPWSIAIADYDRDGLLDIYLPFGTAGHNELYCNNGDRTFTPMATQQAGALVGAAIFGGAAWADYDDDGSLELFTADKNNNRAVLWHNDGTGRFTVATSLPLINALAGAWADYDNDGRLDLCVAAFGGTSVVYHNLGNGQFERAIIGQTIQGTYNSVSWADYDSDGFLDLFLTTGGGAYNALYRNNGDGTFTRIQTGSVVTEQPPGGSRFWSTSGLWFDYDNDGFLDLYVVNLDENLTAPTANFLYHNNGNSNGWLTVKPVGTASNRDGVGAKVRVQAKYAGQVRWQRRDISGGDAINGNNLYAHFGLGDATNVMTLRIEWPSGAVQELTDVASRQFLTIWEPPALRGAALAGGSCQLTVTAEPNRAWRIEASSDLKTWEALTTLTSSNVKFQYTDKAANGMACRFYRVVAP